MSRARIPALALCAVLLVGTTVLGATNTFAHGYPKTKAGVTTVKGTATPDTGFTLGNKGTAVVWPAGRHGGVVTSFPITVDPTSGAWSADLTGLPARGNFVIVVQVTQTKGTTTQTIASPPKTRENEDED
jgi:hypothetical protein